MTERLDVLVVESSPRAGAAAVAALEASGHRVHRCHDDDHRGFSCRGMTEDQGCPVEQGIDVALLVRSRVMPKPTAFEDGVRCAIRAGVPLVEDGPEVLDPFAPWVADRLEPGADVVGAVEAAVDNGFDPLRRRIEARIAPLASSIGVEPTAVRSRIERVGSSLEVHLDLPVAVPKSAAQALAVRVLDAVRTMGRTIGNVDVFVHDPADPPA
jgi:hypothetical protein